MPATNARRLLRAFAVGVLVLCATFDASAQSAADAKDGAVPASRWKDDLDRIDGEVRLVLLSANDPRSHYVAGRLDSLDVESAVGHFATARIAAPQESLYLASLALACLQRVQPAIAQCDGVDRLADWARRDTDNGLPQLWLAERARKRNDKDAVVAYIDQAAAAPRFDDYAVRGTLQLWDYFRALDLGVDPAAKAAAALNYAAIQPLGWYDAASRTCISPPERTEALRAACAKLGATMTDRGASMLARRTGTLILERNANDAATRERAQSRQADVSALATRCTDLLPTAAFESTDPATRNRAIAEIDARLRAMSASGEVTGCERLLARAR